jgi:hypothetical protein
MFRNNIVRNAVGGLGGQSVGDGNSTLPMRRLAIVNNLWLSIDRVFFTMAVPPVPLEDFLVDHNTVIPTRYFSYDIDSAISPAFIRFQFTNNLTGFGTYGVKFPRSKAAVARWLPGAIVASNALVDLGTIEDRRAASSGPPWELSTHMYVVLTSAEAAGLKADGRLAPKGPLKLARTDGKDIGVDFEQLERVIGSEDALASAASGR